MRAQNITYDKLLAFKMQRLGEGASPSTVKYELSLCNTGLKTAHRAGRLLMLPLLPQVRVENTRTVFFDDDEFTALVNQLSLARRVSPSVVAVVAFMNWTGWRRSETLTREWRHVDFARGVVKLEPGETKSGKGRTFPFDVLPQLGVLLRQQRDYTDAVELRTGQIVRHVFHREGQQVLSIRQAWRTACANAGFTVRRIPHDFRRTAVRRLERAGVPRSVAKALVGHETDCIYDRYAITNEQDLRDGLAKVAAMEASKPALRIRRVVDT